MKKQQIALMIIGFVLLALMATNPSIEDHRQAVLEKVKDRLAQASDGTNQWEKVGQAIGVALGQGIVEKAVSRKNYLLFSITTISLNEKPNNIGYGFLGKVWVKDNFENLSPLRKSDFNQGVPEPDISGVENAENSTSSLSPVADIFILGCYPPNGTNLILSSPNINSIHPAWAQEMKAGGSLGSGWGFNAVKRVQNNEGVFLYGNIYTTRGGLFNSKENGFEGMVWVPLSEWNCSPYPQ